LNILLFTQLNVENWDSNISKYQANTTKQTFARMIVPHSVFLCKWQRQNVVFVVNGMPKKGRAQYASLK